MIVAELAESGVRMQSEQLDISLLAWVQNTKGDTGSGGSVEDGAVICSMSLPTEYLHIIHLGSSCMASQGTE